MSTPRFEVLTPLSGFILNQSRLDIDEFGSASDVDQWVDLMDDTTSLSIQRGGEAAAGLNEVDTGSANLTMWDKRGAKGLEKHNALRPNRKMRVVADVDRNRTFEWPTSNPDVPQKPSATAFTDPSVRFYSRADSVPPYWTSATGLLTRTAPTTNLHVRAFAEDGPTVTLTFRVRASATGSGHFLIFYKPGTLDPQPLPAGWTFAGSPVTSSTHAFSLTANVWREITVTGPMPAGVTAMDLGIRLGNGTATKSEFSSVKINSTGAVTQTLFTGKTSDVVSRYEKDRSTALTLQSQDAVADLANITRYGAIAVGGFETYAQRITRLSESSTVPFNLPQSSERPVTYVPSSGWKLFGSVSGLLVTSFQTWATEGVVYQTRTEVGTSMTQGPYSFGAEREITGLTPGRTYRIEMTGATSWGDTAQWSSLANTYAVGVKGIGWGPGIVLDKYQGEQRKLFYEFVAPQAAVTIQVACSTLRSAGSGQLLEALHMRTARLFEVGDPYRLQSIGMESNLADHLSLASDSVGSYWYVGQNGEVEFKGPKGGTLPIRLVDRITESGDVSYTEIDVDFATASIVNDIDLTNHGYDPVSGNTSDLTYGFTDDTSVATYGPRSKRVATSLYLGGQYEYDLAKRVEEIFTSHGTRQRAPRHITFNAEDSLELTTSIELQSRLTVVYDDQIFEVRVVGISHEVTPADGWQVHLTLDN